MRRILLSGGSGLIGSALRISLEKRGIQVVRLVRRPDEVGADAVLWRPEDEQPVTELERLEGCDGAVHLGGANLASHRWNEAYRKVIRNSRVYSSRALARVLGALRVRPPVLVAASATGIYGDRGDEILTENSAPGQGFLPQVCEEWEAASDLPRQFGVRVVHLRFGVVLSPKGGALATMLPAFRAGLGGRMGSGQQWMSWLTLPDAVRAIEFALEHPELEGPCNTVSPEPVTNKEWTQALAAALHRPAVFVLPAFVLRAAFGQMAQDTMLASTRAIPERLQRAGFAFEHSQVQTALSALL